MNSYSSGSNKTKLFLLYFPKDRISYWIWYESECNYKLTVQSYPALQCCFSLLKRVVSVILTKSFSLLLKNGTHLSTFFVQFWRWLKYADLFDGFTFFICGFYVQPLKKFRLLNIIFSPWQCVTNAKNNLTVDRWQLYWVINCRLNLTISCNVIQGHCKWQPQKYVYN